MMKSKLVASLIVLAAIATAAWTSMGQSQRSGQVLYEYRVIYDFSNSDQKGQEEGIKNLNHLGSQGWEIVAVTTESTNYVPKIWLKRVKR